MISRKEFLSRVMILGQYCYTERGEITVKTVFTALKSFLQKDESKRLEGLLPSPLRELWQESPFVEVGYDSNKDYIVLVSKIGNYPYKAAAERDVKIVFAGIREFMDESTINELISILPDKEIFEKSKSCSLNGSAENFL
ncbi:MAG: DUF2267 domain-containing protein [Nitrospirota bacterium]